jgi:rubrerythrin
MYGLRVLTRRCLLQTGLLGGVALALPPLGSAATPPDQDLAYLRLLIGVELLAGDFYSRALAAGKLDAASSALVRQMRSDERAHYDGLAALFTSLGQVPATAADIDFAYPRGATASRTSILHLAQKLESLALGAYLGAVQNLQTPDIRLPVGQIAANEAQHASAVAHALGAPPIGRAFAPALQIDAVSSALDLYES